MTYKTRQEVFRAAADWMDVCEADGVEARCKCTGCVCFISSMQFDSPPEFYEFPLALLEGKEVWVGSELYLEDGRRLSVLGVKDSGNTIILDAKDGYKCYPPKDYVSWNPPKPKTVMVEMLVEDAEWLSSFTSLNTVGHTTSAGKACKKALENL